MLQTPVDLNSFRTNTPDALPLLHFILHTADLVPTNRKAFMQFLHKVITNPNPLFKANPADGLDCTLQSSSGQKAGEMFPKQAVLVLCWACGIGDMRVVNGMLAAETDVNQCDESDLSPLMHASQVGNANVILTLVSHGADVNLINNDQSCLLLACENKQWEAAKVLYQYVCDADMPPEDFDTESLLFNMMLRNIYLYQLNMRSDADRKDFETKQNTCSRLTINDKAFVTAIEYHGVAYTQYVAKFNPRAYAILSKGVSLSDTCRYGYDLMVEHHTRHEYLTQNDLINAVKVACANNQLVVLPILLPYLNSTSVSTLITHAYQQGHYHFGNALFQSCKDQNTLPCPDVSITDACKANNIDSVKFLIKRGKDVNAAADQLGFVLKYTPTDKTTLVCVLSSPVEPDTASNAEQNSTTDVDNKDQVDSKGCEDSINADDSTVANETSATADEDSTATGEGSTNANEDSTAAGEDSRVIVEDCTATGEGSTAIDEDCTAPGEDSIAASEDSTPAGEDRTGTGEGNTAVSEHSTVVGEDSTSTGDDSTAVAKDCTTTGEDSIAASEDSIATGEDSQTVDEDSMAIDKNSTATGEDNTTDGEDSTAVDGDSTATGERSAVDENNTAAGKDSTATGEDSKAVEDNTAFGKYSTAMGEDNTAAGEDSTVVGKDCTATSESSTTIGEDNTVTGEDSIAASEDSTVAGEDRSSTDEDNTAVGKDCTTTGEDIIAASEDNIATGEESRAIDEESLAVGKDSTATGEDNITGGGDRTATDEDKPAVGEDNIAAGEDSTVVGEDYTATGKGSTAVGEDCTATGEDSIAASEDSTAAGEDRSATGEDNTPVGEDTTVVSGDSITVGKACTITGEDSIAAGEDSSATGEDSRAIDEDSTAIGKDNTATGEDNTAVDEKTVAGEDSTATGEDRPAVDENSTAVEESTVVDEEDNTAVGKDSTTTGEDSTAVEDSAAFGNDSTATGKDSTASGEECTATGVIIIVAEGITAVDKYITAAGEDTSCASEDNTAASESSTTAGEATNASDEIKADEDCKMGEDLKGGDGFQDAKDYTSDGIINQTRGSRDAVEGTAIADNKTGDGKPNCKCDDDAYSCDRVSASLNEQNDHNCHPPLVYACTQGNIAVVKLLLQHGADVNTHSEETPLTAACKHGHREIVDILLSNTQAPSISQRNMYGLTPLQVAVKHHHGIIAKILIKNYGADPNECTASDIPFIDVTLHPFNKHMMSFSIVKESSVWQHIVNTVPESEIQRRGWILYTDVMDKDGAATLPIVTAFCSKQYDLVKFFIDQKIPYKPLFELASLQEICKLESVPLIYEFINAIVEKTRINYQSAFEVVVKLDNAELLNYFLSRSEKDTRTLANAMIGACEVGSERMVRLLIQEDKQLVKAVQHDSRFSCRNPLCIAIKNYDVVMTKMLHNCGAQLFNDPPVDEFIPRYALCQASLQELCSRQDEYSDILPSLLPDHINQSSLNHGLIVACKAAYTRAARLFLARSADVNCCDDEGVNPLLAAIHAQSSEVVALLLKAGADPDADGNSKHGTPLYAACELEHCEIATQLIDAGANTNPESFSPILTACQHNYLDIVQLLLDNKADPNHTCSEGHILHVTHTAKHYEAARLLLEYGADPRILLDLDMKTACKQGYIEVIQCIVQESQGQVSRDLLDQCIESCFKNGFLKAMFEVFLETDEQDYCMQLAQALHLSTVFTVEGDAPEQSGGIVCDNSESLWECLQQKNITRMRELIKAAKGS